MRAPTVLRLLAALLALALQAGGLARPHARPASIDIGGIAAPLCTSTPTDRAPDAAQPPCCEACLPAPQLLAPPPEAAACMPDRLSGRSAAIPAAAAPAPVRRRSPISIRGPPGAENR